jgi:hypothetical protein
MAGAYRRYLRLTVFPGLWVIGLMAVCLGGVDFPAVISCGLGMGAYLGSRLLYRAEHPDAPWSPI